MADGRPSQNKCIRCESMSQTSRNSSNLLASPENNTFKTSKVTFSRHDNIQGFDEETEKQQHDDLSETNTVETASPIQVDRTNPNKTEINVYRCQNIQVSTGDGSHMEINDYLCKQIDEIKRTLANILELLKSNNDGGKRPDKKQVDEPKTILNNVIPE